MTLTKEEQATVDAAVEYIKGIKQKLVKDYVLHCDAVDRPVTLFMAGSPGAGKTEVSKHLVQRFKTKTLRIDADELRALCPGYTGSNAHLFQKAANKAVNILFDAALKKHKCNIMLDGTFAYADAMKNIQRAIDKGHRVEIWFVYQDPLLAWEFTKAREVVESRRVNKDIFIRGFIKARENITKAKSQFGNKIVLNVLVKNTDNTDATLYTDVDTAELDSCMGESYTKGKLNSIIQ